MSSSPNLTHSNHLQPISRLSSQIHLNRSHSNSNLINPSTSTTSIIDPEIRHRVAALQRTAFLGLGAQDWSYLIQTTRLISLRDQSPERCAAEATIVMRDRTVPRCWRARAAVYRAESLMSLGFVNQAKIGLMGASRILTDWEDPMGVEEDSSYPKLLDTTRRESYETLEALVAWNVAMGKINWGMVNDTKAKDNRSDRSIRSGPILAAGWPISHSLSALDLKWC